MTMTAGSECYVGLMSGTSLDGVDVVLADFSGDRCVLLAHDFTPFPETLRQELLRLHTPSPNELEQSCQVGIRLAEVYAGAVRSVLVRAPDSAQVRAVGCHGQTVRHRPELGFTLQLNQPARLAELTGLTVVADFRSRDIAAGGQGAPLVPAFHAARFGGSRRRVAVVNIGGISNVTLLPDTADEAITGFDCGPGNMLMDAWCREHLGQPHDADGAWAAAGHVDAPLLQRLLAEPYFALPPPKSTGRDLFSLDWLKPKLSGTESAVDVQATLLAVTVQTIVAPIRDWRAEAVYLCGGGAFNSTLVDALRSALAPATVESTAVLGVDPQHVEALAFAWLAQECLAGRPGNLPAVTGAAGPRILGAVYPA